MFWYENCQGLVPLSGSVVRVEVVVVCEVGEKGCKFLNVFEVQCLDQLRRGAIWARSLSGWELPDQVSEFVCIAYDLVLLSLVDPLVDFPEQVVDG